MVNFKGFSLTTEIVLIRLTSDLKFINFHFISNTLKTCLNLTHLTSFINLKDYRIPNHY